MKQPTEEPSVIRASYELFIIIILTIILILANDNLITMKSMLIGNLFIGVPATNSGNATCGYDRLLLS